MTINSNKNDFIVSGGSIWETKIFSFIWKKAHTPWERKKNKAFFSCTR